MQPDTQGRGTPSEVAPSVAPAAESYWTPTRERQRKALHLLVTAQDLVEPARGMGRRAEAIYFTARTAAGLDGWSEGTDDDFRRAEQLADEFLAALDDLQQIAAKLRALRREAKA